MERTRSLIIVGFAILMAVSLVMFYAPNRNSGALSDAGTEVLARVGGDNILVADFNQRKETMQQNIQGMGGGQITLAQLGYTDERFVNELIQQRVVAQEAERLGLAASDQEVAARIREYNKDASGKVNVQQYMERVGDVDRYERQVRDSISAEKLRAFITAGVRVSDEEVQRDYQRGNTTFGLVYVPVAADKLAAKINPSDEELRAYYEQHKTDYRILEAQKKIRYLFIDQSKAGEKLQIPEAELRAEFDKLAPENKVAGVRVQQIVLRVAHPDLDATVRAKADTLVAQARGQSGNASEQDFGNLAKGNSEDPATAKNGGMMAGVVKKNPNKPDDPYQKVLDLAPGAVTEPIKYNNAYYILRRGDVVNKTYEDAKQELLVSMRNRRAYLSTSQLAQRAAERLKETKDFQRVAQELAAEANMNPAEMIKETPFVKPGDDVPNIGSSQQFEQAIEPLNNQNDTGDRTPVKGGFAIPMLVDKREPNYLPSFEEARDKALQALRTERARAQLEETARSLASGAANASDLKAAAERLGLEAKTEESYKLGSPLGEAGTSPAADELIYALKEGEVTKTPIKIGDNWVVVGATKRTEADLAEFAKQRETLTQNALAQRQSQVFEDYLSAAQARMQSQGKIEIYNDVLAKLSEGEEPAATLPQGLQRGRPRPPLPTR
jgi:peptidyl-prolyl cis-trans isomerase D